MQGVPESEFNAFSEFEIWLDLHFDIEPSFSAIDLMFLKRQIRLLKTRRLHLNLMHQVINLLIISQNLLTCH